MRKWIIGAATVIALACAPLALAAASPAVVPKATTAIFDTAATLNGTVNPDSATTTYRFAWGPTNALGSYSPATPASAGKGDTAVAVSSSLAGLTPGTTYYFQLQASNASGASSTPIETFKTAGNPPPGPTTGAALSVERYQATLTGTIAPNNQATTYYFQYGLTTGYGLQTNAQTVPAGTAIVPVSATIPGLQPGATFHYRLVATHGATSTSYGADGTVETLPFPRPRTRLFVTVTPHKTTKQPFKITVQGRIGIPRGTPASLACGGVTKVSVLDGSRRLAGGLATVQPNCQYSLTTRRLRLPGGFVPYDGARLTISVQYRGDAYVAPSLTNRTAITVT